MDSVGVQYYGFVVLFYASEDHMPVPCENAAAFRFLKRVGEIRRREIYGVSAHDSSSEGSITCRGCVPGESVYGSISVEQGGTRA